MSASTTVSMKLQFRTIDGLKIRYADSGGPHERVVLDPGRADSDPPRRGSQLSLPVTGGPDVNAFLGWRPVA